MSSVRTFSRRAPRLARTLRRYGVLEVASLILLGTALGSLVDAAFGAETARTIASGTNPAGLAMPLGVVIAKDPEPDEPGPYIWAEGEDRVEVHAVPVPGCKRIGGRATVLVDAPLARVREALLDVRRYADFMPHVSAARVLRQTPGGQEVFLEVTPAGGPKLWAHAALARPRVRDGVETIATTLLDGNVDDLRATFRLRPLAAAKTELTLELHVDPRLPLPDDVIDGENLRGVGRTLVAVRRRVAAP